MTEETITEPTEELGEPATEAQPEHSDEVGTETATDTVETEQPQTYVVDGTEYTEDELKASIMRQADYTRKTQELAEQRKAAEQAIGLIEALETNPVETARLIQEYFVEPAQAEEDMDPVQAELKTVKQQLSRFEQEQAEQRLQTEIQSNLAHLHKQYGDFDDNELLQHAVDNKIANLEAAYTHRQFLQERAKNEQETKRMSAVEAAEKAKRDASFVEGGSAPAAGSTKGEIKDIGSIEDAYQAVLAESRS